MTAELTNVESPRPLLVGSAALFIASCAFPVAVSVFRLSHPPWWVGVADVLLAAALAVVGLVVAAKRPGDFAGPVVATAFRIYRRLAHIFLILLVVFFLAGDRILWSILLPGLAWRAWLFVLVLPSWVSVWQHGAPE